MSSSRIKGWWISILLTVPALIPLAKAYVAPYLTGRVPTGFIQDDMPVYVANAREHFDQGFQLTYGNPYAPYGTPAIYFQPHLFLVGLLHHLGLDPGIALNLFGIATLIFTGLVAATLYRQVVGFDTVAKRLGVICFFWGGGVLTFAGFTYALLTRRFSWPSVWKFDIVNGWWAFNFGRNLVYATEAYYHGLFLLALLLLLKRKMLAALGVATVLSLSHPFTGLSLALILVVYSALELAVCNQAVTRLLLAGSSLILIGHLAYYLVFLNRFADHRALQDQWELPWLYKPSTYVPALLLVAVLAAMRFIQRPGGRQLLQDPSIRLFLVCFLVIFALSQHNLIHKPIQPAHFACGYDWVALFFIGAPVLIMLLDRLLAIPSISLRVLAVCMALSIFLFDNLFWFGSFIWTSPVPIHLTLTKDQKSVLDWVAGNAAPPDVVVCDDAYVSYLVSTYTSVRSWQGHILNTPHWRQRHEEIVQAFAGGRPPDAWEHMRVVYVASRGTNWRPPANTIEAYHNAEYSVWVRR